ncbi:hypothetical protein BHE74_00036191 [Ensete ventricosum]|nr:hypothetical protein GW17_00003039 [Ensete ventricosum]RWW57041.1 hypothetical protein BHE74_00036191 [Ensete ventricosum]
MRIGLCQLSFNLQTPNRRIKHGIDTEELSCCQAEEIDGNELLLPVKSMSSLISSAIAASAAKCKLFFFFQVSVARPPFLTSMTPFTVNAVILS